MWILNVFKLTPCNNQCPAGENIQQWLFYAAEGDYEHAWRILTEENPLPACMGRVCYHTCEGKCNRGFLDESVGINSVERFLGDYAIEHNLAFKRPSKETGKKILVIGAGPAGLSAAYQLRRFGHSVHIVEAAKEAGADYVGLDEFIEKIKGGWTDVDVIICTPSVMAKVGAIGRILGPRGLMPNPKTGTVTMEIGNAVKEVKAGKIDFKVDKTGIVHAAIGKVSFTGKQIFENASELINAILKLKPQTLKGTYMKAVSICSTMSPGISVDVKSIGSAE